MRNFFFFLILSLISPLVLAQEEDALELVEVDSLYREDQFYLGFTYNILTGSHDEINQSGFSGGFHAGFIRDWPLNERRNIAIGTGVGWSVNTYGQNLFIGEDPETGESIYQILDEAIVEFESNRFVTHAVEAPIQFRWRTSSPESHKFWRVYTGLKLGYVYYFHSTFDQPGNRVEQTQIPELNRFRMGATFNFGYSTFNFHFYYSLNSFFNNEATINGEALELRNFQVGLMFYLL